MSRLLWIAWREYLENVKTKAFLLAVFMTPVLMGLSFLIPKLLAGQRPEARHIAVADVQGDLGPELVARLGDKRSPGAPTDPLYVVEVTDLGEGGPAEREVRLAAARDALDARVKDGTLFAWIALHPSVLDRKAGAKPSEYRTGNLVDMKVLEDVQSELSSIVKQRVVARANVPPDAAEILTTRVPLEPLNVLASGKAGSITATVMPFVFTLLLFLTIVSVSQALITSTLEEKANRVIEVLLSSVSPFHLMAGKILGTCAVGLTLMTIWAIGGIAGLAIQGLQVVDVGQLGLCAAYYLLGFLLIASLMVAAGSACNTLKEAQNLLTPMMFLLTLPMFFWIAVGRDPSGTLARTLSFIPVFTPFLMMMRVASTPAPPPMEIAASLVVLAVSAWLAMRLAARVFRVGILMYGKPPSVRELFRWMRTKG